MIRSPMITVSVFFAFLSVGSRKAFTPLLTASTPVSAVHPLANAFSISHAPTIAVAGGMEEEQSRARDARAPGAPGTRRSES